MSDDYETEKQHLQSKLKKYENDTKNRQQQITNIDTVLKEKQQEINILYKQIDDIDKELTEKEVKFKEMVRIIKKYKEKKKERLQEKYILKYEKLVDEINKIKFTHDADFEKGFEDLTLLIKQTKIFTNLEKKAKDLFDTKKKELLNYLRNCIVQNIMNIELIHELSFSVSLLKKYELFFDECVFVDIVYENVYTHFHYHFMTERKTNRLDKPEWFLNFLIDKINENKRVINIYNLSNNNKNTSNLLMKIQNLIELKFEHLTKQESTQKRNLIIHFAIETDNFTQKIFKDYKVKLVFKYLIDFVIKQEKERINDKMETVHLNDYKKWFVEYKSMFKECFSIFVSMLHLDPGIINLIAQHIADNVLIYCEVFIKHMRYISRDEIHLLCLIFSEIENLKYFIAELENDIIINLVDGSVGCVDLSKISRFNNENLKLIKLLAVSDIEKICKRLRNFKYISDKNLVAINIDIANVLGEYMKYLEHANDQVEKQIGEYLDNFIIGQIVIVTQFESYEYYRFKDFFKVIKENFKFYNEWKTNVGCKCIEDIFNGRKDGEEDSLFNLIYKNYV